MDESSRRRVGVLFSRLSGYMAACLKALQSSHDVELLVVRYEPADEAPFEAGMFDWIDHLHDRSNVGRKQMQHLLLDFAPQAVYIAGWFDREYLAIARRLRSRGVPVIAGIDRQWKGTWRQRMGQLSAPWYLHPAIDVLWAAGERQRQFAEALGYGASRCWSGVYACDWGFFASAYEQDRSDRPKSFLYLGRYVPAKGLDVLVEAYKRYRRQVRDPWPLLCAGTGPHASMLRKQEGVTDMGFVQPSSLPQLMAEASAFILPSRHEPWGVVLQEAAATGLPLISSNACGAAVHLLQDGYNGFIFEVDDVDDLVRVLVRMSEAPTYLWSAMSRRSHELSKQFTPERWAATFIQGAEALRSA